MLAKLLKYEFRSTWKMVGLMNLFILVITVLGCIPIFTNTLYSPTEMGSTITLLSMTFYCLSICVVSFAVYIYVAVRFYRNLYTDEGYLMHTLPVTPKQLLWSKLISASLYNVVTTFVILISVFVIVLFTINGLEPQSTAEVYLVLQETWSFLQAMSVPFLIIGGILYLAVTSVSSVLMCFCAVNLGQLFGKKKVLSSILSYIGLYALIQTITSICVIPAMGVFLINGSLDNFALLFNTTLLLGFAITSVTAVLLYLLNSYLMKHKLNLD